MSIAAVRWSVTCVDRPLVPANVRALGTASGDGGPGLLELLDQRRLRGLQRRQRDRRRHLCTPVRLPAAAARPSGACRRRHRRPFLAWRPVPASVSAGAGGG